jgi:hypothetical protein
MRSSFNYKVKQIPSIGDVVVIVDRSTDDDNYMSVTNDAENVVEHIVHDIEYIPDRFVYCDTMNTWSELEVETDGKFCGFLPLGEDFSFDILKNYCYNEV